MWTLMILCLSIITTVTCDKEWLTSLPDSRKLNTLAFIGTHDTASYGTPLVMAKTQDMTITQQLEAGIRVFDMRVRRTNNVFAMHHGLVYLGMVFGELVREVESYLNKHPEEFVIMFMQEEYDADNSTMSECEILAHEYLKDWPNIFVQNWLVGDTIGRHRGKILLARANRGFRGCVTELFCKEQNNYDVPHFSKIASRDIKWNHIKALQDEVSGQVHQHWCYINFLSGYRSEPTFSKIANALTYQYQKLLPNPGEMSNNYCESQITPFNIPQLGLFPQLGFYTYSKLGPCKLNLGMNGRMATDFHNPRNTLYIILADFPSQTLIDKIVDSNS